MNNFTVIETDSTTSCFCFDLVNHPILYLTTTIPDPPVPHHGCYALGPNPPPPPPVFVRPLVYISSLGPPPVPPPEKGEDVPPPPSE